MKGLVYNFVQLAAIIMILITLAVSTAAVAQLVGADTGDAPQSNVMLASGQ